jgi:octanoyl-[GcvH]:protein N-octanoyltransferase
MLRASEGAVAETLRLYRPDAIVAFGRQDMVSRGFAEAVQAAQNQGFAAVLRLAGGRAAVFHEGTIAFARAVPDPDPTSRTFARFGEMAEILASALRSLGVDARIGEVPGEYCPGEYSVNARGETKLAGIGQRLIARAAHVGGVVVATGSHRVRDALVPVYEALDLSWDPSTAGSAEDEVRASWTDVEQSIIQEIASRFDLEETTVDDATLGLASKLEPDHRVSRND